MLLLPRSSDLSPSGPASPGDEEGLTKRRARTEMHAWCLRSTVEAHFGVKQFDF